MELSDASGKIPGDTGNRSRDLPTCIRTHIKLMKMAQVELRRNICNFPNNFIERKYFKQKAVLLEAWSGPEGSRKLMFADFMTTAQDGSKVANLTHGPLSPPGNTPDTHFC
jgi:hypothetical protein